MYKNDTLLSALLKFRNCLGKKLLIAKGYTEENNLQLIRYAFPSCKVVFSSWDYVDGEYKDLCVDDFEGNTLVVTNINGISKSSIIELLSQISKGKRVIIINEGDDLIKNIKPYLDLSIANLGMLFDIDREEVLDLKEALSINTSNKRKLAQPAG